MFKLRTYFLWALASWILCDASLAEDLHSDYVCILGDSSSNQCDSFCLTELHPMLNEVVKRLDRGTCDADNEIKEKLTSLEVKTEGHLNWMEETLLKMEDIQATLGQKLLAVQTRLADQLQALLTKLESERQVGCNKMDAGEEEIPNVVRNEVPANFELIGSRYFRIVNEVQDWATAASTCRDKGGYLASFQNENELNAVASKLNKKRGYWLGITYNRYVSIASNRPAQFLRWKEKSNDNTHEQKCVYLSNGQMSNHPCDKLLYFICQADNES